MQRLHIVTENAPSGFNVPVDRNVSFYSSFQSANLENVFKGFAIKYIYKGTSHYKIESGDYELPEDSLLVAPRQPGKVCFEEKTNVVALCTYIDETLVKEAYNLVKGQNDLDNLLDNYFSFPVFFEKKYMNNQACYQRDLRSVASSVYHNTVPVIDDEWFFHLAGKVVATELDTAVSLSSISAVKPQTRKELLKRLMVAREFMNDNYLQAPEIETIAREAALSKYHFFRRFKDVFHVTPFQYMQSKRLEFAKEALQKGNCSISSLAAICSFPDSSTFSKAFKRKFKLAPLYFLPPGKIIDQPGARE